MSNWYNIDWNRFIAWNLPGFLRTTVRLKWFGVLLHPFETIRTAFMEFRAKELYKLNHSGQVVYLQAVLNDKYDSGSRRIYIENQRLYEPVWFFDKVQGKPVYHYDKADNRPVRYYNRTDYEQLYPDFIVFVPEDLRPGTPDDEAAMLAEMRALIDYYKIYSKNYDIQWIN